MYVTTSDNAVRQERGLKMLEGYMHTYGGRPVRQVLETEGVETVLGDMLSDLLHGVQASGVDSQATDLETVRRFAHMHFTAESNDLP